MSEQQSSSTANVPTRVVLKDLLIEMKTRDELIARYIEQRSKVQARWTLLAGLVAVVVGSWMAYLIFDMMGDMDTMSKMMVKMDRSIEHMPAMSQHMLSMKNSMGDMNQSMQSMQTDMHTMSQDIRTMRDYMAAVPQMQQDVGYMAQNVYYMRYDTHMMRQGVSSMSHDTHDMGKPFRIMDDFIPWK